MQALLEIGASNAVVASGLAIFAVLAGRLSRHPVLEHGLWVLVFVKLLTPPLVLVPLVTGDFFHEIDREEPKSIETVEVTPRETEIQWLADPLAKTAATTEADFTVKLSGAIAMDQVPISELPAEQQPRDDGPLSLGDEPAALLAKLPEADDSSTIHLEDRQTRSFAITAHSLALWLRRNWQPLLLAVWFVVAIVVLARAVVRIVRFQMFLRSADAAPLGLQEQASRLATRIGLRSCPRVLLVGSVVSPMVWAIGRRPRLLLPRDLLAQLDDRQIETLLVHELAHLRRRDHWVRGLELFAVSLYWWHPVVWWARHRIRELEETDCDSWVVSSLPSSEQTYATALLNTLDFLAGTRLEMPPAAMGIGHVNLLKRRLAMIMRGTRHQSLSIIGRSTLVLTGLLLLPWAPTFAKGDHEEEKEVEKKAEIENVEVEVKLEVRDDDDDDFEFRDDDEGKMSEELLRRIGQLLVDGKSDEAKELADKARASKSEVEDEDEEDEEGDEDDEDEDDDDEDESDDEDRNRKEDEHKGDDGDSNAEREELRQELVSELTENLEELQEQLLEAAGEWREGIAEALSEVSQEARQVIAEVDVRAIIDDVSKELPPAGLRLIQEVDLPAQIERALAEAKRGNEGEHPEINEEQAGVARRELETELRSHMKEVGQEIRKAIEEAREGIAEAAQEVAREANGVDLKQVLDEAMKDAPEQVKDILREANIEQAVANALREAAEREASKDEPKDQVKGAIENLKRLAKQHPQLAKERTVQAKAHKQAEKARRDAEQTVIMAEKSQKDKPKGNDRSAKYEQRLSRLENQMQSLLDELQRMRAELNEEDAS